MSPDATRTIICNELGIKDLSELFEWVDLEAPLGAASIAQVGTGALRSVQGGEGTIRGWRVSGFWGGCNRPSCLRALPPPPGAQGQAAQL